MTLNFVWFSKADELSGLCALHQLFLSFSSSTGSNWTPQVQTGFFLAVTSFFLHLQTNKLSDKTGKNHLFPPKKNVWSRLLHANQGENDFLNISRGRVVMSEIWKLWSAADLQDSLSTCLQDNWRWGQLFSGQLNTNLQCLFLPGLDAAEAAEVAGIHHNIQVTDLPLWPLSLLRNIKFKTNWLLWLWCRWYHRIQLLPEQPNAS